MRVTFSGGGATLDAVQLARASGKNVVAILVGGFGLSGGSTWIHIGRTVPLRGGVMIEITAFIEGGVDKECVGCVTRPGLPVASLRPTEDRV